MKKDKAVSTALMVLPAVIGILSSALTKDLLFKNTIISAKAASSKGSFYLCPEL